MQRSAWIKSQLACGLGLLTLVVAAHSCACAHANAGSFQDNNLGKDLIRLCQGIGTGAPTTRFQLQEDRWVYLTAQADMSPVGRLRIFIDQTNTPPLMELNASGRAKHRMVRLKAGTHQLTIQTSPSAHLTDLRVRQIPALIFNKVGASSRVKSFGPFDWPFLKNHILPSVNTLVSSPQASTSIELDKWRKQGGQWWTEVPLPRTMKDPASSAAEYHDRVHRLAAAADGVLLDELTREDHPFQPWLEFLELLNGRLSTDNRLVVPYWGGHCETPEAQSFLGSVFSNNIAVVRELYLPEPMDFDDPHERLKDSLIPELTQFPGASERGTAQLIMALGYQSAPPESLDVNPQIDFKVWMDHQMYNLATDPRLGKLGGVMHYISRYADEEYVRWAARLYRHYALEGNSTFLSEDFGYSYILTHLFNGNFADGFSNWKLSPARSDSITLGSHREFTAWQGLMGRPDQGRSFAVLRQDSTKTSRISQKVRHLVPGRSYSLRFVTANIRALSNGKSTTEITPLNLRLTGAQIVTSKSFEEPVSAPVTPPFSKESPPIIHFHRIIFRALHDNANLTFSLWPCKNHATIENLTALSGGQIQPYFLE